MRQDQQKDQTWLGRVLPLSGALARDKGGHTSHKIVVIFLHATLDVKVQGRAAT